jgi:diguanylate cyclase (GGDEF)-like protein
MSDPDDARDQDGEERDGVADDRDRVGDDRDSAAASRDAAADQRDRDAEEFEAKHRLRSSGVFRHFALARREAAADRKGAANDRRAGAGERIESENDRASALADREASARERDDASVDTLTGVSRRGAGFLALDREIARVRRMQQTLVVGFIDVDHLKAVNDAQGHATGDELLVAVANTLRTNVRASDLIFRYGGDEFVCAFAAVETAFGESRISRVNSELARRPAPASVSAGFAELRPEDSTADLVARADAALYRKRQHLELGDS